MKKKILAIGLVVCMLVVAIGSATMAYFTDTEEATNVMVVGEIDIEQTETDADGNPFEDGQHLLPNVTIDKIVTVENVGRSDAYVRTLIAFEGNKEFVETKLDVDGSIISDKNYIGQISVDGEEYTVYMYVHNTALAQGEKVTGLLNSFTLNSGVEQDEVAFAGEEYNVLVLTQAVQAEGVADNAVAALNAAFGPKNAAYVAGLYGGVVPKYAASAEDLAAALMADEKDIAVVLETDIDLPISSLGQQTGGSGEYKLGGDSTESITINLNGNKLNITTTYWSAIGAKNDDAVFTIKNGTMTSSQATGTWNSYDLTFANCNYVIENVVFEKAVAFTNAGKTATLKDVTINETHDYYALWITAEGQTVNIDGLTVNSAGRGIKIDAEYVDSPAEVTLDVSDAKFITAKKAAILVDSSAGANIKLDDMDIRKVAADSVNAVWVDADAAAYYDKVTVNGGTVVIEPVAVDTNDKLQEAIQNGQTNLVLSAGEYTVPGGAGVTIIGSGLDTEIEINGNIQDMVVKNATVTDANSLNVQEGNTAVFENVVFKGNVGMTAQGVVKGDMTFTDCTFEAGFHIDTSTATTNVTFNDCVFGEYAYIKLGGSANYAMNGCVIEKLASGATGPWGKQWAISYSDITFTDCVMGRVVRAGGAITITLDGCVDVNGDAVTTDIVHEYNSPTIVIQ